MRAAALALAVLGLAACGGRDGSGAGDRDAGRAIDAGAPDAAAITCTPSSLTWLEASPLPAGRESLALVASSGALFALGGWSGTAVERDIFVSDFDPAGMPGAWQASAQVLPAPYEHHGAVGVRGATPSIYLAGGDDGTAARAETIELRLGEGTRTRQDVEVVVGRTPLPSALTSLALVFARDRLYAIGGSTLGGPPQRDVSAVVVRAGGELGSWTGGTPLPEPVSFVAAAIVEDTMVVAGGMGAAGAIDRVFIAVIASDGTVGAWSEGPPMPVASFGHAVAIADDHLYLTGGLDASMTARSEVYALEVRGGGAVGAAWQTVASLPAPRFGHAMTVAGNALVVAGGWPDGSFALPPVATVWVGRPCR